MAKGPSPSESFRDQDVEDVLSELTAATKFSNKHGNDFDAANADLTEATSRAAKTFIRACGGEKATAKVALNEVKKLHKNFHKDLG